MQFTPLTMFGTLWSCARVPYPSPEVADLARIYLSPPDVGPFEREMLLDALDSNWLAPVGPHVDAFEAEIAEVTASACAVAVSSGAAALHLAMCLLEIGEGDVVLAPTLTFVASVSAFSYLGAVPVFIDADPATWNMDPDLLEAELVERARTGTLPKAVVTVDLYGRCSDYDRIMPLCEHYGVPVIEDAAEALGATWQHRPAGSFGAIRAVSFNGNKIITTSGGGMLLTDDADWAARAEYLARQAQSPAPHYEHVEIGYNYRLSNLLAAVGRGQLRTLPERVAARRAIQARYVATLGTIPGVSFLPDDPRGVGNAWLTTITIDPAVHHVTPDEMRLALEADDIETRPVWKPMHLQPVYQGSASRLNGVSERAFRRGLCLPSGSGLSVGDQQRVISKVCEALGAVGPAAHA